MGLMSAGGNGCKAIHVGVGKQFDISQIYAGYKNLTEDNFFISSSVYGGSWTGYAYYNESIYKNYNPETGILDISIRTAMYSNATTFAKYGYRDVDCWLMVGGGIA